MFMPSRGAAGTRLRVASLLSAAGAASCPAEWFPLDGTGDCYRAFEGPLNWDDAKVACEEKGAVLTSIHSEAENDHAIWTCGNTRPFHQGCWIGGTDRKQTNRRWIWIDGSPWDWSKWFDHGGGNAEPNNDFCSSHTHCTYGHTADCNVLEVSGKVPYRGYWLDTFCTDRQKFICKIAEGEVAGGRRLVAEEPTSSTDRRATMQSSSGQELPSSPPLPSPPLQDPQMNLPRSPPLPSPPPSLASAAAADTKTSSALPVSPPLPSPPPQTTETTTSALPGSPSLPSHPPTIPSPLPQTTITTTLAESPSLSSPPPTIPSQPPQETSVTTTALAQSRSLPSPPPPLPSPPPREATTTTPLPESEPLSSAPPEPPLPPPAPPEPPPLELAAEEVAESSDEDDIYQ